MKLPQAPSAQAVLSVLGLLALAALGGLLIFDAVPPNNVQLLTFILGAVAGAVTGGSAVHMASAAGGGDVTVNPPSTPGA